MKKYLLISCVLCVIVLLTTHTVFGAEKKVYYPLWENIILKQLLTEQLITYDTPQPTSVTPSLSISPTITTIPSQVSKTTPTPFLSPTPTIALSSSNNNVTTFLIQKINDYRASKNLSPVQTSNQTCSFATTRAAEITSNFSHDGFTSRQTAHTIPYPTWSYITENIAMTTDYTQVITMWENSPGHAANMRADTPYVCVIQNGNYFAYEGMKP